MYLALKYVMDVQMYNLTTRCSQWPQVGSEKHPKSPSAVSTNAPCYKTPIANKVKSLLGVNFVLKHQLEVT